MKSALSFSVFLFSAQIALAGPAANVDEISCTAIREEPGAPTFGFDLAKESDGQYTARYLEYPGDESLPPTELARIENFECRFWKKNPLLFQCQRLGASLEGIAIKETKLSLSANELIVTDFNEMRAVGNEVPGIFMVFRFGPPDTCTVN